MPAHSPHTEHGAHADPDPAEDDRRNLVQGPLGAGRLRHRHGLGPPSSTKTSTTIATTMDDSMNFSMVKSCTRSAPSCSSDQQCASCWRGQKLWLYAATVSPRLTFSVDPITQMIGRLVPVVGTSEKNLKPIPILPARMPPDWL